MKPRKNTNHLYYFKVDKVDRVDRVYRVYKGMGELMEIHEGKIIEYTGEKITVGL